MAFDEISSLINLIVGPMPLRGVKLKRGSQSSKIELFWKA